MRQFFKVIIVILLLAVTPAVATEGGGGGGGGGSLTMQDEGAGDATITTLNCTGAGVTCTPGTGELNVAGGGATDIRVHVKHSIDQSIPTGGGGQAIVFDTEVFDTDTMHSTVSQTSRLTINTTGTYLITCEFQFASGGTGTRQGFILLNSATVISEEIVPPDGTANDWLGTQTLWELTATNYVECFAFQDSGLAKNVRASGQGTEPKFFAICENC